QRVSSTSSLRMSCTVRNPISGRNRPNAISPATAASLSAWAMSGVAAAAGASTPRALISHLLHVRAAEQALGQEDERDGEDREGCDVLVVDRKIRRPHGFDETDEKAADEGARQRADAAEHRRGEGLDPGGEAVGEIHHAVV